MPQVPWNFVGSIYDAYRGLQYGQAYDEFQREQIDPFNQGLQQEATRFGMGGSYNPTQQAQQFAQQGQAATNQAFKPVVPGYQQLYQTALGDVKRTSRQAITDVNTQFDRSGAEAMSNLASRGLATSTVAPSVRGSLNEQRNAELRRVNDQMLQQRLGVHGSFGAAVPGAQFNVGNAALDNQFRFGSYPIDTSISQGQLALDNYMGQYLIAPAQPGNSFQRSGR